MTHAEQEASGGANIASEILDSTKQNEFNPCNLSSLTAEHRVALMIMYFDILQRFLGTCVVVLVICMNGIATHAETPADAEAQEVARVTDARDRHDANGLFALADEYKARWKRGERAGHILIALDKLATSVATWEWKDFKKQIELPREIGLFVLENAPADTRLKVQVDMALCVCDTLDQNAPSFTAAERKRRAVID